MSEKGPTALEARELSERLEGLRARVAELRGGL
jgi:hypothetical protein